MKLPKLGDNKKAEKEQVKDKGEKKEKKVKKEKEDKTEGSRWSSVILLVFVLIVSGCVWAYGVFTETFTAEDGKSAQEDYERGYENTTTQTEKVQPVSDQTRIKKSDSLEIQSGLPTINNFEENPGF